MHFFQIFIISEFVFSGFSLDICRSMVAMNDVSFCYVKIFLADLNAIINTNLICFFVNDSVVNVRIFMVKFWFLSLNQSPNRPKFINLSVIIFTLFLTIFIQFFIHISTEITRCIYIFL